MYLSNLCLVQMYMHIGLTLFQCSFGNLPCLSSDAVKEVKSDLGFCMSINSGNHDTVLGRAAKVTYLAEV